jgi:TPR repeat protein
LYDEGQGVSQDYVQTTFWYRKAAEQGYAKAQYNLGVSYVLGQGVPQDYAQAALWYRKAAEQGYAEAQVGLGSFEATQHDFAEAYFWIDLATAGKLDASDMERAVRLRDDDAVILTPAELSREQERVRKWLEAHQAKPQ